MISLQSIIDMDLRHKRVIIREDFNVPILQDRIINDRRIRSALPTIEYALSQDAAVILLSHLGRPPACSKDSKFSLIKIANALSNHLNKSVKLAQNWTEGVQINPGEIVLCENLRLQPGEIDNDPELSQKIVTLGDVMVMDAFSVAHLNAASTVGAVEKAQHACAGLLLLSELENLSVLEKPEHPLVALIGGAKVSTKIKALENLIERVDHLLLGGHVANVFLTAQNPLINPYCHEPELLEIATRILKRASNSPCKISLPLDVITNSFNANGQNTLSTQRVSDLKAFETIEDIGPLTIHQYSQILKKASTIFWNGPMGRFENVSFQKGTKMLAQAIAKSSAYSIAGGGETLSAIDQWQLYPSCTSTGGGALLAWLTGKPLPMVQALQGKTVADKSFI